MIEITGSPTWLGDGSLCVVEVLSAGPVCFYSCPVEVEPTISTIIDGGIDVSVNNTGTFGSFYGPLKSFWAVATAVSEIEVLITGEAPGGEEG